MGRRAAALTTASLLSVLSTGARAWDINFGMAYEYQYTDNVELSHTLPRTESSHVARTILTAVENSPQLTLRGASNIEYRDYVRDVFEDGVYGSVSLAALWTVTPQRLNWAIEDYFSQTVIDVRATDTPNNRQNTNILSTGPDFLFRINSLNSLEISARYSNQYYEITDSDNDRLQGDLRWIHRLSQRTDISLNYQTQAVQYANDVLNRNFVRDEAFARMRTRPSRSEYTLDLGTSTIKVDGQDRSVGALARLGWRRELNPRSNFLLGAGMEYSDHDRDLQGDAGASGGGSTGSAVGIIGGYYYGKRFDATYSSSGSYSTKSLHVYWRELDYENAAFDQAGSGVETELGFDSGPLFTPALMAGYEETSYMQNSFTDEDQYAGLRLRYRVRARVAIALEGRQTHRTSTVLAREYDETRGILTIGYNRQAAAGR